MNDWNLAEWAEFAQWCLLAGLLLALFSELPRYRRLIDAARAGWQTGPSRSERDRETVLLAIDERLQRIEERLEQRPRIADVARPPVPRRNDGEEREG